MYGYEIVILSLIRQCFLSSTVVFLTSKEGISLARIKGKDYKKIKGTAYRTYYACVDTSCHAQVVISDLKGGFIKILKDHKTNCKNNSKVQIVKRLINDK